MNDKNLTRRVGEATSTIEELVSIIQDLENDNDTLRKKLSEAEEYCVKLEKDIEELEEQSNQL